MSWFLIDIFLCLLAYTFLLLIFIFREQRNRGGSCEGGDDEGGIPEPFPPDFDLPPGVCLPDDPRVKRHFEEEILV